MYKYIWDTETGGLLLQTDIQKFSKEPRPVYYKELDILGFDKYWLYPKDDKAPIMWAEANNYIYKGRTVAKTKGGALYTPPEIILLDEPEPAGKSLEFVDIAAMIEKNREIMETLAQETIQKIYNTYQEYKNKIDVFYVAFSGGKDSIVTLDVVQRALPHSDFKVMFGDTDMELPTTIELVKAVNELCDRESIQFYEAKSDFKAIDSWRKFGPPARQVRWCCTVHKTAPVINKLCDIYGLKKLHSMMITGVRADESFARSNYDELSVGKKLAGQYSFHPLLEWSSAEIFLHIYMNDLLFNAAYKVGFNRVGCIMCPNSSSRFEYLKMQVFPKLVNDYVKLITDNSKKDLSGNNKKLFLENGGWKTRISGRELKYSEEERFSFEESAGKLIFKIKNLKDDWKIWYRTIGEIVEEDFFVHKMEFKGVWRNSILKIENNLTTIEIENSVKTKNSIEFVYLFKCVLAKSQYCILCKTCVAECSARNIRMDNGIVSISDKCTKCHACLKMKNGCIYYNSIKGSNDMKSVKGVNRYFSVGVEEKWIKSYMADQTFEPGNKKTDAMFTFMNDAKVTYKRKITEFGNKIVELGLNNDNSWALMFCNQVYTPAFGWFVTNISFNEMYPEERLMIDMEDAAQKARGEFWNSFKTIIVTNDAYKRIGLGMPDITEKINKNGDIKRRMNSITREKWQNPDDKVILYSLYKFAEACGGYYQFTLKTLLDDTIERDGISPTRIFGLEREDMMRMLNGLTVNYPDFISATFSLDLDSITLRQDKTSTDVLNLF